MTIEFLVRRLSAPVIVFLLTLASTVATVHAAENPRKMTVVSFGLFGDEGVFRREATGAAANRRQSVRGGPSDRKIQYQDGRQRDCRDACNNIASGSKKDEWRERHSILILTSHGSRDGLAVVAGRLVETLKPFQLSKMLARTGVRNKVVIISACYSGVHTSSR